MTESACNGYNTKTFSPRCNFGEQLRWGDYILTHSCEKPPILVLLGPDTSPAIRMSSFAWSTGWEVGGGTCYNRPMVRNRLCTMLNLRVGDRISYVSDSSTIDKLRPFDSLTFRACISILHREFSGTLSSTAVPT